MRIVGGEFKGRVLKSFDGDKVRPTSDMARESLFNILRNKIAGARFLDLFCGTGAMGIEAISRGADFVLFNDYARESISITKQNLEKLAICDRVEVRTYDAVALLDSIGGHFDIVFMDPPYKSDVGEKALKVVSRVLNDGGIVIFENEDGYTGDIEGLVKFDERKYGRARFTFFKKES